MKTLQTSPAEIDRTFRAIKAAIAEIESGAGEDFAFPAALIWIATANLERRLSPDQLASVFHDLADRIKRGESLFEVIRAN